MHAWSIGVNRYFASRDELLTALVIDAYDSLGDVAEAAAADARGGFEARWLQLTRAIRAWALANPSEYALIYGSPVPGYEVTQELPIPRAVRTDLAAIREAIAPDVPDPVLSRTLYAWTQLFGAITFELFGQYENVIHDRDELFDHQMRRAAHLLMAGG